MPPLDLQALAAGAAAAVANPPAPPKPVVDVTDMVAPPNFAPKAWQATMQMPAGAWKPPVPMSPDLERVLALPRRPPPEGLVSPASEDQDEVRTPLGEQYVAYVNAKLQKPPGPCRCAAIIAELGIKPRPCIRSVRFVQAWALCEIEHVGGCFGQIGVGHGKTILNVLAPLAFKGCKKAVLLLPPGDQYNLLVTYRLLAEHYHVPALRMWSSDYADQSYGQGTPVLHVVPYTMLSQPKHTGILNQIAPDVVIADEVDTLGSKGASSRKARFLRYFMEHIAEIIGCAVWTGSITNDAIEEYAHLLLATLRMNSPVPTDPAEVKRWGTAINATPRPAPAGELLRFCQPGEDVRSGYARRLRETPGVILTTEAAVEVDLEIAERDPGDMPREVQDALRHVRSLWQRPDGEELVEVTEVQACARQLAAGFYYRWVYPRGEPRELIELWFECRSRWFKALRRALQEGGAEHLDSPDLLTKAAMRAWGDMPNPRRLPEWKCDYWPAWRDIKDRVKPSPQAVRIHPYLAEDAAAWARDHRGVVWYADNEFGKWVSEISRLPQHVGGPNAPKLLAQEKGDRSIICSIKAHGRGRDGLQRIFDDQLIANPPAGAKGWEQLLGRFVRSGQRSGRVRTWVYAHTPELKSAIRKATDRAAYVKATTGNAQKLLDGLCFDVGEDDE